MVSHLFNRCSKCCTSRKSGTGTLLFDGMYDEGKTVCFYKTTCSAATHALLLGSVSISVNIY